ncbi:2-oxo acid dehydrogenase subunit E2 [Nocardia amamiensis]|uniref:Dihydrolipoamide acetyltransferase component of pyruvate dehydrogenase complex n=1 Tax=Nocardia amamiensis TaxID=404578 RepID=A0ABS0CS71_9NOCA|nr:dihydrolipoamide acetyltransferase family protein [Nocardia amamiensis]MBF6298683.1 2-oxo acid dehydrogenase subunit E2 [Nocardia amamiensis]
MEDHARQPLPASVLEFRLPDLGEGLTDAELVSWAVEVGDTVQLNQTIAEVETAKAVVSLPCPFAGRVVELLAQPGDTVAVGAPLIRVEQERKTAPEGATGEPGRSSVLVGYGPEEEPASRRRRPAGQPAQQISQPVATGGPGDTAEPGTAVGDSERSSAFAASDLAADTSAGLDTAHQKPERQHAAPATTNVAADTAVQEPERPRTALGAARAAATPAARKLARELGIDLWFVAGSGPGGAVTVDDVRGAVPVSQPRPSEYAGASAGGDAGVVRPPAREVRTPISGIRKRTAAAMLNSARTIPQASTFVTVDCTASMELLDHLRSTKSFAGLTLTPLSLVAKSALAALADFPGVNAFWDEANQEIVTKHYVNLGIAVATDRGLLVPNIKEAQTLSLRDLTREIGWLADTARSGGATPADLRGGTFTITNVGVFGVDAGVPLVNPGEAAILCLGAIRKRPWVFRDELAVRWVTTLGVSFDHRMIDGQLAARFLATTASLLEDPLTLLSRL